MKKGLQSIDKLEELLQGKKPVVREDIVPLKPEFQGKVILAHAGTGKSFATRSNPDIIDGDVLYQATNTNVGCISGSAPPRAAIAIWLPIRVKQRRASRRLRLFVV